MPRLTDAAIRRLKPQAKLFKKYDADGLFIEVPPNGHKRWRFRYQINKKSKLISLGPYPEVTLADARAERDKARKLLRAGQDPSEERKKAKRQLSEAAEYSFKALAERWLAHVSANLKPATLNRDSRLLQKDLLPELGPLPVADLKPSDLLRVLKRVEGRAVYTAHRARALASRIFRFGVVNGWCERDIAADLVGALKKATPKRRAAVTTPEDLAEVLKLLDGYRGTFVVEKAIRLAPMLMVRPGELRRAEWPELDLEGAMWRIPGSKMKAGRDHIVPLPTQAVELFRELKEVTGHRQWVFPGGRTPKRPMSENAITAVMRSLHIDGETQSWHGFRATASTLLHERGWHPDVIEVAQARAVSGVRGIYNRAAYLDERRVMLQDWADYLDQLRGGTTNVVAIGSRP